MANPSDYQTYLDYINNRNSDNWREFWFYNYITDFRQNNRLFSVTKKPYSDYSWIAQSGYYNFTNIGGLRTPPMFASDILDVYISSNGNDLYSYSVSGTSLNNVLTDNSGSFWDIIGLNDNGTVNGNGNNAGQSYSYSLSNTSLESVLSHISQYFKNVNIYVDGEYWSGPTPPIQTVTSNGGGATHIAKVTGQLSSLSNNLSDILMVSGGGGGGLISGETEYTGKEAGGISGSGDNSANQSTGYAFGQGESGTDISGGGSGLYGGYKGTSSKSGGAGSGYIGNTLVSNKKMVGYNVPTSEAESTKTESVEDASENPVSGKPKIGNGYAKIKLIRALPDELVLYDNGQVNTDYFDTDAEIGETQAEPISKNYEVKSNHLLLEYNNWQDTQYWRGILLLFNKKTFPSVYTKVKIDLEIYAKYNGSWSAIEFNVNDNQTGVKNFNGGDGVIRLSDTRYQIGGRSSFEATSRYVTDEMELTDGNNYLTFEFSGVNQYHEAYAKIYKITLTM